MPAARTSSPDLPTRLSQETYLLRDLDPNWLAQVLPLGELKIEKLFSNRPIYTAFLPQESLDVLYVILGEGVVVTRSTPLDRIIALTYPGGCFGMRNLPFSYGLASRAFPSSVEAYKTTFAVKLPLEVVRLLVESHEMVQQRYAMLFELRVKFQYHLLNCSTYPPQAVAALLRALIYQERTLGSQPDGKGLYHFDLPVDLIARACQLNPRTVEQVLKGMRKVGLVTETKSDETTDLLSIADPEGLKEVYSATRDKVAWWPVR